MAKTPKKTMTPREAFTKLLNDKKNGLNDNLRSVWKHRHARKKITIEKIEYQLKRYSYKEVAPGAWV